MTTTISNICHLLVEVWKRNCRRQTNLEIDAEQTLNLGDDLTCHLRVEVVFSAEALEFGRLGDNLALEDGLAADQALHLKCHVCQRMAWFAEEKVSPESCSFLRCELPSTYLQRYQKNVDVLIEIRQLLLPTSGQRI